MPIKDIERKREAGRRSYHKNKHKIDRAKRRKVEKEWRKANPEKVAAHKRTYYKKNGDKERARVLKYYHKAKEKKREIFNQQARERQTKVRELFLRLKQEMGGRCSKCGYKEEVRILNFHHLNNGDMKEGNISEMRSEKKIIEEAKKCILLCPNCHALEHL
jgi:hypothetical protein